MIKKLNHTTRQLLTIEQEQLEKLNQIVRQSIEEENLVSEKLYQFEDKNLPFSSQMADKVTAFGGSWQFIGAFTFVTIVWIFLNLYWLTRPFDPYPFILLNLFFSTLAALQAPVIMMSQNRKEEKDRQRAINDYMVNLKAEIEVRNLHQKLDLLIKEQMTIMFETQKEQMEMIDEIKAVLQRRQAY